MNITEQTVRPDQCAILFGIPTTIAEFRDDVSFGRNSFARGVCHESVFLGKLSDAFEDSIKLYRSNGVKVYRGAKLRTASAAFRDDHLVLILFSHWDRKGMVELRDGLRSPAEFVKIIPDKYNRILDLTVCHPLPLVEKIRAERQLMHVKWSSELLSAAFWLWFYAALFALLSERKLSYLDAFEYVDARFRSNVARLGQNE